MSTTTSNMGLVLPTVSSTPGPTYASEQNQSMQTVDAHDHTFGKGVRIPPSGLDISSELAFGGNAAVELQSTQFESQTTALTGLTASLYFLNGDLYAIDGDGTSVRVTENGSLSAAGTGTIAGLPSGTASAAFSASTFTFKSSTNRYATMAGGPLRVRRGDEDNPNFITLQPPASLAGSYSYTLPGVFPATTQFLTVDNGGVIGGTIATSLGITRAMQAAVGQQLSSSCGAFAGTSGSPGESITNLNVTITTTGRPVVIMLVPDGTTNTSSIRFLCTTASASLNLWFDVTGSATTTLGWISLSPGVALASDYAMWAPSSLSTVYAAAAGTYTFTAKIQLNGTGTNYQVRYARLLAYEL